MKKIERTNDPIIIAIDGYSGCGKSTLAKDLAKQLNYIHIDSGSLYRAISIHFIRQKVDLSSLDQVKEELKKIDLHLEIENGTSVPILNGESVAKSINLPEVANIVSKVAAIPVVRDYLVGIQQSLGKQKAVIMDGRDIGTVIFPDAELKLFVTASIEIRVQRRLKELKDRGISANLHGVRENLLKRDEIDSTRENSPLRKADDAISLDTTHLSREQQLEEAIKIVDAVISERR